MIDKSPTKDLVLQIMQDNLLTKKELTKRFIKLNYMISQQNMQKYLNGNLVMDDRFLSTFLESLKLKTLNATTSLGRAVGSPLNSFNEACDNSGLSNAKLSSMLNERGIKISPDSLSKTRRGERGISANLYFAIMSMTGGNVNGSNNARVLPLPLSEALNCGGECEKDSLEFTYIEDDRFKKSLKAGIAYGDSLYPDIDDKDIIIYDTDLNVRVKHGELVVYSIGDGLKCMIFLDKLADGYLEFRPHESTPYFIKLRLNTDDEVLEKLKVYKIVKIIKQGLGSIERRLKQIKEL